MIAKAIASTILEDSEVTENSFIYVKGAELLSRYVGDAEKSIVSLFKKARENKFSTGKVGVIFIDEAEALLPTRGSRKSSDVETTIVPTFLAEMDGLNQDNPFVILATNHPGQLDAAVIRPGRIDVHVEIKRPNSKEAEEIFAIHLANTPLAGDINKISEELSVALFATELATKVSGALIENICKQATHLAIARVIEGTKPEVVTMDDLKEAFKLV